MNTGPTEVTKLLRKWSSGDEKARDLLVPLVYDELRRLANFYLQSESPAHTLQSTALVHEVYLRLCQQQDPHWDGRAHFFAVAGKIIRQILVDHARRKSAVKRGGKNRPQSLDESVTIPAQSDADLLLLDESLNQLAAFDPRKSQVVEMRFFGGMAAKDIARVLGTTEATVRRDWNLARAWLFRRMQGGES